MILLLFVIIGRSSSFSIISSLPSTKKLTSHNSTLDFSRSALQIPGTLFSVSQSSSKSSLSIRNLIIHRSTSNFLYSFGSFSNSLEISRCVFSRFLASVVSLNDVTKNGIRYTTRQEINENETVIFNNCIFENIVVNNGMGGAIYDESSYALTVNNCQFTGCSNAYQTYSAGGAIFAFRPTNGSPKGDVVIKGTSFTNNRCLGYGSSIYAQRVSLLNISGCTFINSNTGQWHEIMISDVGKINVFNTKFGSAQTKNIGFQYFIIYAGRENSDFNKMELSISNCCFYADKAVLFNGHEQNQIVATITSNSIFESRSNFTFIINRPNDKVSIIEHSNEHNAVECIYEKTSYVPTPKPTVSAIPSPIATHEVTDATSETHHQSTSYTQESSSSTISGSTPAVTESSEYQNETSDLETKGESNNIDSTNNDDSQAGGTVNNTADAGIIAISIIGALIIIVGIIGIYLYCRKDDRIAFTPNEPENEDVDGYEFDNGK